jgi:hypothetical protein
MFNLFSLPQFDHTRIVIWYQTKETFRNISGLGVITAVEKGLSEFSLGLTHKAICEFYVDGNNAIKTLDNVYNWMQGEVWSPNGEARDIIRASGCGHTSMSSGDVVQIGDRFFSCEMFAFKEINECGKPIEESKKKIEKFWGLENGH